MNLPLASLQGAFLAAAVAAATGLAAAATAGFTAGAGGGGLLAEQAAEGRSGLHRRPAAGATGLATALGATLPLVTIAGSEPGVPHLANWPWHCGTARRWRWQARGNSKNGERQQQLFHHDPSFAAKRGVACEYAAALFRQ
jgi:hypothetical protein